MAVQTGIEPAISCVTGRHVNRYTTGPVDLQPLADYRLTQDFNLGNTILENSLKYYSNSTAGCIIVA